MFYKFRLPRNDKRYGFTMIELLIVMAVIGILAALLLSNLASTRSRARDVRRKADLDQTKKALRLYYNDFQQYPADNSGDIYGCGAGGTGQCDWGSDFTANGAVFMKQLPLDPVNSGNQVYDYTQTSAGDDFLISVMLENLSDQDAANSQARCQVSLAAGVYVVCGD